MSFRRLGVILRHLPVDSAYCAEIRDELTPEQLQAASSGGDPSKHGRWSLEAMLGARNGDLLQLLLWQNGGNQGKAPDPYPRPGVQSGPAPITDAGLEYLLKTRELRGAHPNG